MRLLLRGDAEGALVEPLAVHFSFLFSDGRFFPLSF